MKLPVVILCTVVSIFPLFIPQLVVADQLSLEFLNTQYFTESNVDYQPDVYSDVVIDIELQKKSTHSQFGFSSKGIYSLSGTGDNHLSISEVYWGQTAVLAEDRDEVAGIIVGRKKFLWSRFDKEWGMGLWQPTFRWDSVHPEQQGLTGVFRHGRIGSMYVLGFVSGIHLPTQGAQFEVNNGKIESANRWFESPAHRFIFNDESTDLHYKLKMPEVEDVVFQGSFAVALGVNQQGLGPWGQVAFADKPSNRFHIAVDGQLALDEEAENIRGEPVIYPISVRHSILTSETGYRTRNISVWGSYTVDKPRRPQVDENYFESDLNNVTFLGLGLAHRLPSKWIPRSKMSWGYLRRWDGDNLVVKNGFIGNFDKGLSRFEFDESEVLSGQFDTIFNQHSARKMDLMIRYMYSPLSKGSMLSGQLGYRPSKKWAVSLGFDVLGSQAEEGSKTFFGRNRGNDRLRGGFSYVF